MHGHIVIFSIYDTLCDPQFTTSTFLPPNHRVNGLEQAVNKRTLTQKYSISKYLPFLTYYVCFVAL